MGCRQILLIEDERDARETLHQLLELEGFCVTSAENGREGLKVLSQSGPPCLIVLDLMMPIMNGWEFLEALQREHQEILMRTPIIVVSAAADIGQGPGQLGCRVMKKPFDLEPLLSVAREHCTA